MTPNELIQAPFIEESNDLLFYSGIYGHPFLQVSNLDIYGLPSKDPYCRVSIRTHALCTCMTNESWTIRSFWFDGSPVMISSNGGREGDDWYKTWILNPAGVTSMLKHLHSLTDSTENLVICLRSIDVTVASPDMEIPEMTELYGGDFDIVLGQETFMLDDDNDEEDDY